LRKPVEINPNEEWTNGTILFWRALWAVYLLCIDDTAMVGVSPQILKKSAYRSVMFYIAQKELEMNRIVAQYRQKCARSRTYPRTSKSYKRSLQKNQEWMGFTPATPGPREDIWPPRQFSSNSGHFDISGGSPANQKGKFQTDIGKSWAAEIISRRSSKRIRHNQLSDPLSILLLWKDFSVMQNAGDEPFWLPNDLPDSSTFL
ncbi:hypothetical protein Drorol1_Dr00025273, partial [Drosera rotundifolia]